jgi:regulatory protein
VDAAACRQQALDLLARREHSRLELERKLSTRSYADDVIADTLDALERAGLLDSSRFAESFARSRIARGQGPLRIQRELIERGLSGAMADSALAALDIDWTALARSVRTKKFGASVPRAFAERVRESRFLQYRGFTSDQIRAVLDLDPDYD